jgi:hypothetical protein
MSGEVTRLGPADWEKLDQGYLELAGKGSSASGRAAYLLMGAVFDLNDQVGQLQQDMADLNERDAFNTRLDALKAAREHLAGLPSEQANQRGYSDHAMKPGERIAQELAVARYLLGGAG